MLLFYMNNVVFLPHFLIDTKTITGVGVLAHLSNYASYISLLRMVLALNCVSASFWHIVCCINTDAFVKSPFCPVFVIPAKAGIQVF